MLYCCSYRYYLHPSWTFEELTSELYNFSINILVGTRVHFRLDEAIWLLLNFSAVREINASLFTYKNAIGYSGGHRYPKKKRVHTKPKWL